MIDIEKNYHTLQARIRSSLALASRGNSELTVVAVSKKKSLADIRKAYRLGLINFGENYLQEAIPKIESFEHDVIWHFLGSIQSNKAKEIAKYFDWVHTLTRDKIANRLNDSRSKEMPPLNICLQVKLEEHDTRDSLAIDQLHDFALKISELPNLKLRGLMGITSFKASDEQRNQSYQKMRSEFETLTKKGLEMDTLSMGMSDDLEIAIQNHSNMIRIGTALFGSRE
jgi:pyridoxal phosphate enzyme (YggS family)